MDSTQRTRPRGVGSPVGLVIFIILTVVFALTSYWGFAKYKEAEQARNTAVSQKEKAERDLEAAREELEALQAAAGAPSPAALSKFVATALEKTREAGFGSEAQNTATDAMQAAVKAIEAQRDAIDKLSASVADLTAQVKSLSEQKTAASTAYEEEIANLQDQIDSLHKQVDNVKAESMARLQQEIERYNRLQNEYYNAQDNWRDLEMKYILHVAELQEKIRNLSGEGAIFEEADGIVTEVNHLHRKATIDVGSEGGAKPGMRFVIYARDAAGGVIQKGVVEVLDTTPEVSVTEIISTSPDQAIGKGDFAYNLAGPEKRLFVFAGRPQYYTLQEWQNFIRANGGEVVAEVQEGDQVADYLIIGKFEEDDPTVVRQMQAARDFGLTIITEERLKEAMGLM